MLAGLLLVAAYATYALARSLPAPALHAAAAAPAGRIESLSPLAWPLQGDSALAIAGIGTVGTHGDAVPGAIASVAKVMTAYVVLRDHPLAVGEQGPVLRVSTADARSYRADAAAGQSVLPVRAHERLTELEALEGLLLPSGNNIAVLLGRWDAGSESAFVSRMNAVAARLGLSHTHYTSASGLDPGTVSTALDQVRLAQLAFAMPVFRQIVAMPEATLPVAGRQYNVDTLLGHDGIVGIKTGTTSSAGGCFVFAARVPVGSRSVLVVGAVLHQPADGGEFALLSAVFGATTRLLSSTGSALAQRTLVRRGQPLGTLTAPWTGSVALTAGRAVRALVWKGLRVRVTIPTAGELPASFAAGQRIGFATVRVGTRRARVPLLAARSFGGASLGWRLTHP